MKKKKYLPLYYKWMKKGMPDQGLCSSLWYLFQEETLLELFEPTEKEYDKGGFCLFQCFWAADGVSQRDESFFYKFTPLRQNIVLFMAAMNGEL
jgi:hypothetical protein